MTEPEYDYAAAAALLGVSEGWLREHTPKDPLPHRKFSENRRGPGPVRFSDAHIAAIRKRFEVLPEGYETPTDASAPLPRRTRRAVA